MRLVVLGICIAMATALAHAEATDKCSMAAGRWDGKVGFSWERGQCDGQRHCNEGNSDMPWGKWAGIVPEDLRREGAELDARMEAEPGEMRCVGKVHDGALQGSYSFTPNPDFARRMEAMGFDVLSPDRLQGYAMLDVTTAWVKDLQDAHVSDLTTDRLMGLRALKVDAAYVRAMAADGYPELAAEKLTGMKAVGVTPEKVSAIRAMGYSPTEEELIQMSVFKIDAPFVEKMKARGFKDLTIAQLIKIKVFKLDE
jgi:hypothetical protein